MSGQVDGSVFCPRGGFRRHGGQTRLEYIANAMNDFCGRFNPLARFDGGHHIVGDHVVGQGNGFTELDVLVGAEQFSTTEMETDRHQMREWEVVGLREGGGRQHRPGWTGFEPDHVGETVARAFWEQHASKTVSDPVCQRQQGAPVEVHGLLFAATPRSSSALRTTG